LVAGRDARDRGNAEAMPHRVGTAGEEPARRRTVLVTGSTSGIGREVARLLCGDGHTVIGAARSGRARLPSPRYHLVKLDLTDDGSIESLMQRIPHDLAKNIDGLINVAGSDVGGLRPFEESASADLHQTVATNFTGLLLLTRTLLPQLLKRSLADVINVTSVNAVRPAARLATYSAAKAGVRGFTEALRGELAGTRVRVTEILPGMTRTGFAEARWKGDRRRAEEYYRSMTGTLTPREVAEAVLFCLRRPRSVVISELVIVPTQRPRDRSGPGDSSS
jgi:3-hydroxy acid dehydrogenase / malonic semialdehyde reductase